MEVRDFTVGKKIKYNIVYEDGFNNMGPTGSRTPSFVGEIIKEGEVASKNGWYSTKDIWYTINGTEYKMTLKDSGQGLIGINATHSMSFKNARIENLKLVNSGGARRKSRKNRTKRSRTRRNH